MPSVYSVSKARPRDSSTVITPSLPTRSITSAISRPIAGSAAEIAATCAISARPETSLAMALSVATSSTTARSMPRFRSIGLAPAATFFRPSVTIAWASTVAVVVPSPATSLVLVAASLSSWAPMFAKGSASSISLATVTPSWVTVGAPNFLSSATLRPFGPSVVLTASASVSMPVFSDLRASASNSRIFAGMVSSLLRPPFRASAGQRAAQALAACPDRRRSLRDDRQDGALLEDEQLLVLQLELGPGVLGEEDGVADLDLHRELLALVRHPAGADGEARAALRPLGAGVGQDDAAAGRLLARGRLDHHAVAQRAELRRGCGLRHGAPKPPTHMRALGAPMDETILALNGREC